MTVNGKNSRQLIRYMKNTDYFAYLLETYLWFCSISIFLKLGRFMHQPFIKFLTQQFTYFLFIIFIIISSVIVSDENINTVKLSVMLKDTFYENYTKYTERTDINQHFQFTDFSIRIDRPTIVDYLLSVWIIGEAHFC